MEWIGLVVAMVMLCGGCAYDPTEELFDSPNLRTEQLRVMEVTDELIISQNMAHIDKLILNEGAVIRTQGADVTLRIGELISHNAIFDTTPNPKVAPYREEAKSGGELWIIAENAQGALHILSKGQAGWSGKNGVKGATGAKGGRGNDAETKRECNGWLSVDFPLSVFRPDPEPRCHWETVCKRRAGNGGQGHRGGAGTSGENGSQGGDTAKVLVDVVYPVNFRVTFDSIVGTGGIGGSGGAGGNGGEGGDSGHGNNVCGHAAKGPQGSSGPTGAFGTKGNNGSENPICLRLGNTEIGKCLEFEDLTRRGEP